MATPKPAENKKELDKLELVFTWEHDTKRARLFQESLGDVAYSDQDVAVSALYVKQQALEKIGYPKRIKVTIEPIE
jgi:uncharacterized protein YlbG (UPF0298 family)